MMKLFDCKNKAGFTLLLGVVITAVVMMLGVTISGILQREALISVSSQASTKAFYAADTALECVMYYDRAQGAFATSSPNVASVNCLGTSASAPSASGNSYSDPYERSFLLDSSDICTGVVVEKRLDSGRERTFISARGRNTCDDTPNRAERALKTAY